MGWPKPAKRKNLDNLVNANIEKANLMKGRHPKLVMTNGGTFGGFEHSTLTSPPAAPSRVSPVKKVFLPGETKSSTRSSLPRPKRRGRPRKKPKYLTPPFLFPVFSLFY